MKTGVKYYGYNTILKVRTSILNSLFKTNIGISICYPYFSDFVNTQTHTYERVNIKNPLRPGSRAFDFETKRMKYVTLRPIGFGRIGRKLKNTRIQN